eukprot:c14149_g1_i1 orf=37-225(+)
MILLLSQVDFLPDEISISYCPKFSQIVTSFGNILDAFFLAQGILHGAYLAYLHTSSMIGSLM